MKINSLWARQLYSPITWNHTQEPCFWEVTLGGKGGQSDIQLARFVKAVHVQKSHVIPEKKCACVCAIYIWQSMFLTPFASCPLKKQKEIHHVIY